MTTPFSPVDRRSRSIITEQLGRTLFVEASAGTGKTTSLVSRVVNLITTGSATLDSIAVITFTEAAAAELRQRIRTELEKASSDSTLSSDERDLCNRGVEDLDESAILTLHSFANLLLRERPLEAGLPPSFEVSDEVQADIRFNEEWDDWLDGALEQEPLAGHMSRVLTLGLPIDKLKSIAQDFHNNYDYLSNADFNTSPMTPQAASRLLDAVPPLENLCLLSMNGPGDQLYDHVQDKLASIRRLEDIEPGSNLYYRFLRRVFPLKCGRGRQSEWLSDPETGENGCKTLKDLLASLHSIVASEIKAAKNAALMPILHSLRNLAIEYSEKRRTEGRAEFHDLLVWARDLVRDNIEVRDYFRLRFSHILIDEVQDTDPLQAEIAMFLSEDVAEDQTSCPRANSWLDISPEDGKLFVVGDPKQSIYRFRRADVEQMDRLRQRVKNAGGEDLSLVQNFRSHRPVVDWVNALFHQWMQGGESQANYEEMQPRWEAANPHPFNPSVWALSDEESKDNISDIRNREAQDIATLLYQMVAQGWQVRDKDSVDSHGYRPVTYSDICILMPTRTGLRNLERGLEEKGVPYRLENASLVFETQEVRDLLNCLKAIDDPANQIAVVGALRSPAFGCSDVELLQYHESGGSFDYTSNNSSTEGLVRDSLAVLCHFHEQSIWTSPEILIDRFIRNRGLMEAALDHSRTREQWRRYRFIVEQAWRFIEGGGKSLRAFVEWIEDQIKENVRVTESPVPEADEEAVRVMTVHAAKGLEFPVVILTGINSGGRLNIDNVVFDRTRNRVEVGLGSKEDRTSTPGYEELVEKEQNMSDAEAVRLMYVAVTRACDHLILSLRRKSGGSNFAASISTAMKDSHLWQPVTLIDPQLLTTPTPMLISPKHGTPIDHSTAARDLWQSNRVSLIGALSHPVIVSATSLKALTPYREEKREQETEEPWRRGRAGTSVGRAVHAVLQSIDLFTGTDIRARARVQAVAERVPDLTEEIARLVRVAVNSSVVRRAVKSQRLWREVPVAAQTGHGALHGFIDLLFEEHDGLVIVDYKTDSLSPLETEHAVERYRLQGGAYAYALQKITGKPVKEVIFLYLQPKKEESLQDLPGAIADAESKANAALAPAT